MAVSKKSASASRMPVKLSLVIPCYNEEHRIGKMIDGLREFDQKSLFPYEVIIVNDGSTDSTADIIPHHEFIKPLEAAGRFKWVSLSPNRGKGAALKAGVEVATGTHILTLDADMATRPVEVLKWISSNNNLPPEDEIWIASREHPDSDVTEVSSRRRTGRVFNFLVRLLTPLRLRDTQCGFKLYPIAIARDLFSNQRSNGWAHDVELLYRTQLNNIQIREFPVVWKTQDGSKISPVKDAWPMLLSVLAVSIRMKWDYFIKTPIAIIAKKEYLHYPPQKKREAIFRMLFFISAVILFITMTSLSFQYGITGDEKVQKEYGEKVLAYYTSFGEDTSALHFKNLYFYGGFFDMICAAANKCIDTLDEYEMRHLLNSVFGFLMILFAALIARQISDWRGGFIALVLLSASPQLFGQSMNNPKDVPFAAAYAFTIYHFYNWIRQLPKPSIRSLIYSSIGIAVATGIRVGGLILIGILIVFIIAEWYFNPTLRDYFKKQKGAYTTLFKHLVLVSVVGYFGAMLFWPYGLSAPFSNPFKALSEMENFSTNIRILFAGKHMMSNEIPWTYIPVWIAITTPLAILIPAAIFVFIIPAARKYFRLQDLLLLCFVIVFPWIYAVYKKSSLYDGLRHFLFIVPLITAAAGLFYEWILLHFKSKAIHYGTAATIAIGCFLPVRFSISNHPNQYTYFNETIGGIKGAYGNYETDYWMNSIREQCEWIKNESGILQPGKQVLIASNCIQPVVYYFRNDTALVKPVYVRYYERGKKDWDYAILYSRYIDRVQLINKSWPNTHTIHEVKADDVPLSIVIERKDKSDYYGQQALEKNEYPQADSLFTRAVQYDPKNEEAWMGLGMAQLHEQKFTEALNSFRQSVQIYPANAQALSMLGLVNAQTGNLETAIAYLNESLEQNPNNPQAYYYLGMIYQQKGDKATAEKYFNIVKQFQQQQ